MLHRQIDHFVLPTTALLVSGAAERHERPGRVRTAFPNSRCGRLTPMPPSSGGLVHRGKKPVATSLVDASMVLTTGTWPVLHCCSMYTGGSAVLRITYLDEGLLTPPEPSRGRERPTVRSADTACTDMPQMRLAASKLPAGRVADDARDATSQIPRPAAGDPPHVLRERETGRKG